MSELPTMTARPITTPTGQNPALPSLKVRSSGRAVDRTGGARSEPAAEPAPETSDEEHCPPLLPPPTVMHPADLILLQQSMQCIRLRAR